MRGLWGRLCVVLLLDEMKRRYEKKKRGKGRKVETGRGRRELTVFFREKKDILLDLMDGMIGELGLRGEFERERKEEVRSVCDSPKPLKQSWIHSHD